MTVIYQYHFNNDRTTKLLRKTVLSRKSDNKYVTASTDSFFSQMKAVYESELDKVIKLEDGFLYSTITGNEKKAISELFNAIRDDYKERIKHIESDSKMAQKYLLNQAEHIGK